MTSSMEKLVLMQCQEYVSDYKKDLATIFDDLLSHDIDEGDKRSTAHSTLENRTV